MLWVSGNEYLITKLHVIRNIIEARFLYLAASDASMDAILNFNLIGRRIPEFEPHRQ